MYKAEWVGLSRFNPKNGIITIHPGSYSLSSTIKKAIEEIRPSLEQNELDLIFSCSSDVLCFHDPKWTLEAIYNILDNAVKYTPGKGTISINLSTVHSYIQISISDTGIGISENEYSKIFNRFYCSQNIHNETGLGLGLYLARNIITKNCS